MIIIGLSGRELAQSIGHCRTRPHKTTMKRSQSTQPIRRQPQPRFAAHGCSGCGFAHCNANGRGQGATMRASRREGLMPTSVTRSVLSPPKGYLASRRVRVLNDRKGGSEVPVMPATSAQTRQYGTPGGHAGAPSPPQKQRKGDVIEQRARGTEFMSTHSRCSVYNIMNTI